MIQTIAVTKHGETLRGVPIDSLDRDDVEWYWVDFAEPTEEEILLLETRFRFHPLAIEDCLQLLQRPKLDHYEAFHFLVFHTLHPTTLEAVELDVFLSERYIVTFHLTPLPELDDAFAKWVAFDEAGKKGPLFALYSVVDKIVDQYFPSVYRIEDALFDMDQRKSSDLTDKIMDQVFDIRSDLLQLRRTVFPMRELLYRILNSERIQGMGGEHRAYFADVHDHLLKLSEMIESNREMTADIRDSYVSLNTNRMNGIMKTLTVITTIFMPLTFLAGIYGMNFSYMPELDMKGGYFIALGAMALIGFAMFWWFKRKGWFD
ncbi:magnesium/cobalt transporter CorA [Paenibacillus antri]|uniref:Magnesium transport protein CorA n=1 Tax=Paenibacillus antri TaxID=2582848 RepID=A0A5R9GJK9_9BACL|nr:magnesium/cobalt transporter CorA [Paenibacillus antri]TLS53628.1 magnesium/cobalt transporter CorA [Paenibacillus antri]